MTIFLTGLFSAFVSGSIVALAMAALQINRNENRDDDQSGAPEGARIKSLNRGEVM